MKDQDHSNEIVPLESFSLKYMMNITVVELLILELLIRQTEPLVRHRLFKDVNTYLELEQSSIDEYSSNNKEIENKKILNYIEKKETKTKRSILSQGSFYYSLNKLEKAGFIRFNRDTKGNIMTVEKTKNSKILIDKLMQHFIKFSVLSYDFELINELKQFLINKIGIQKLNTVLIIWIYITYDMRLLKSVQMVSDKLFILSRDQRKKNFEERGLDDIEITTVYNKKIREANEVFDAVLIPYVTKQSFFDMEFLDLLNEGFRVLKKRGFLVIIYEQKAPEINHNALNRLRNLYNKAQKRVIYTDQEIVNIIELSKIEQYELIKFAKESIILAWKS